jgi:hypothetical protein
MFLKLTNRIISWKNEWIYINEYSEKESDKKDYQIVKEWIEKLDTYATIATLIAS